MSVEGKDNIWPGPSVRPVLNEDCQWLLFGHISSLTSKNFESKAGHARDIYHICHSCCGHQNLVFFTFIAEGNCLKTSCSQYTFDSQKAFVRKSVA